MDDELVVIFGSEVEIEAILCREMLESAGIGVLVRRNRSAMLDSGLFFPFSGEAAFELLVPRKDAERAAHLVQQFMAEAGMGQPDADASS